MGTRAALSMRPAGEQEIAVPRTARTVITAVLLGYAANALVSVWASDIRGIKLAGFAVCLALVLLLQLVHSVADVLNWPAATRAGTLCLQAAVTLVPLLWVGPQAGSTAGFLAGAVLLTVRGAGRWVLFLLVGSGLLLALAGAHLSVEDMLYAVYFTWLTGLMVYGVSSLEALARTILSARGDLVRMAIVSERLRLARDLHDLLGFNVSAIILKSELAYRLLPGAREAARQEIQDVLGIARRALLDVWAVADGYGPMSLQTEVESAKAMLVVAEIEVSTEISPVQLPEVLDTVLAIVLREAATNILRHSKAQAVRIALTEQDGQVRLEIANDGVDGAGDGPQGAPSVIDGSGLQNLTGRLAGIAGRLTVTKDDEWFRLVADVPTTTRHAPPSESPDDGRGGDTDPQVRTRPWHLRMARLIVVVVLVGYGLLLLVNVGLKPGWLDFTGLAVCVAAQVGLQITFALGEPRRWPLRLRAASLCAQLAATVLPLLWLDSQWGSMGGFLAGSMLLVLSGRWRWPAYAAVGAGVLALSLAHHDDTAWTAYLVISTLLTGLVAYGVGSLSSLVAQIEHFRQELARMAVARNRLTAAAELNEFLSRDLSLITVKTELAHRLLPQSPQQARDEMAEVLDVARRSVIKVRSVASGYRHRSFAAELDSTVPALGAVGIDVRAQGPTEQIPAELDAVLALVLREATTSLLKVRRARQCRITIQVDDEQVELRVADDRDGTAPAVVIRKDSGLEELATRVRAIDGRLSAAGHPGGFELAVQIPRHRRLPALAEPPEIS